MTLHMASYIMQQTLLQHVTAPRLRNSCVLCRGQIDVMHYLGQEADLHPNISVLFLTPCHATPYYSHIHRNISMEFLDCSPPGKPI